MENTSLSPKDIRHFNRVIEKFYFSPKLRRVQEQKIMETLAVAKRSWDLMKEMDEDERDTVRTYTEFCTKMLEKIRVAEEWSRGRRLTHKRVRLYRHIFRKYEYMLLFDFFKVSEGINKQGTIICTAGLPTTTSKQALFFRNGFSTRAYKLVDAGTFTQKIITFTRGIYTLKCKDQTLRFLLISDDKDEHTFSIVKIDLSGLSK